MISRFERVQFSDSCHSESILQEVKTKTCKQRRKDLSHDLQDLSGNEACKKEPHDLTDVWETVLKPVRQRVIEIEKVLADSGTPRKLSHEDVSNIRQHQTLLKTTISKMTTCSSSCSTDELGSPRQDYKHDLETLKTLLDEEQLKSSVLQESLNSTIGRAEIAEANAKHKLQEYEEGLHSYKCAYTEECDKNMVLKGNLEKANNHIKRMEAEFIKKLQTTQDELHEEHKKNYQLLEDLRSASAYKAQFKDVDELKQKNQTFQEMVYEEQKKSTQLENELRHEKDRTAEEMTAMKQYYEHRLLDAEELLDEEQKMNATMLQDMSKAKEKVEAKIKHLEEDYQYRLKSLQDVLTEEQNENAELHQKVLKMQKRQAEDITHMEVAVQTIQCVLQEETSECNETIFTKEADELQQEIEKSAKDKQFLKRMLSDERLKNGVMQTVLVENEDLKAQLDIHKDLLEKERIKSVGLLDESAKATVQAKEMEEKIKWKLNKLQGFVESEQLKTSVLQDELHHIKSSTVKQAQKLKAEHQNQLDALNETLKKAQTDNTTLKEDREKAVLQVQEMKEHLLVRHNEYQEKLETEQEKNSKLQDGLNDANEIMTRAQFKHEEYERKLEDLNVTLAQEQMKVAILEDKKDKTDNQKTINELQNQVQIGQQLLAAEQLKSNTLQDKLSKLIEAAEEAETMLHEYELKVENLNKALEQEQVNRASLQSQKDDACAKMKNMDENLQERLQAFKDIYCEEQAKITALQGELNAHKEQSQATIEQLTSENVNIKEENVNLLSAKEALEREIENTKDGSVELKSKNSKLTEDFARIMTEKENLEAEIEKLKECSKEQTNEITKIKGEISKMLSNKENLEAEIEKLKNHSAQLISENTEIKEEISKVVLSKESLEIEIERLKCSSAQLTNENTEIKEEISNLVAEKEAMVEEIGKLRGENANINKENSRVSSERELLEKELEKLKGGSKHSLGWSSSSVDSISTDSSEAQEFSDDTNVNNNQSQFQISKTILKLEHKLFEQDMTIKNIESSTCQYIHHQDQKNQLFDAYIHELELIKEIYENEISRLKKQADLFQYCVFETVQQEDKAAQTCCHKVDLETQTSDTFMPMMKTDNIMITLNDTKVKVTNADHMTDNKDLNSYQTKPFEEHVMKLESQLQQTAQQWGYLVDLMDKQSAEICDNLFDIAEKHDEAMNSLFDMLSQLAKVSTLSTGQSDRFLTDFSQVAGILVKMKFDTAPMMLKLKQDYEEQLRQADFKLCLAEAESTCYCSEVAKLKAQIDEKAVTTEAMVTHIAELEKNIQKSGKEAAVTEQQQLGEEHMQDLRKKVKQQRHHLDDAARDWKRWQSKVQDLNFQLNVRKNQLEEKSKSLDMANNALSDLKHDFERERHHMQQLIVKHSSEIEGREVEVKNLQTKVQQLEEAISKHEKHAAGEIHKSLRLEDEKRSSSSEIKQLRGLVKKAESSVKEQKASKDSEMKKLALKLDKANGTLRKIHTEQVQNLEGCKLKLKKHNNDIDVLRRNSAGKSSDTKQLLALSDSCADIMRQVQAMLRRMQKIEELMAKDPDSPRGPHMRGKV